MRRLKTFDIRGFDKASKWWCWDLNPSGMNSHVAMWPTCCFTSRILQSGGSEGILKGASKLAPRQEENECFREEIGMCKGQSHQRA